MARVTGGTTQFQQFWKEQIEKEESAALRFFLERINQAPVQSGTSSVMRKKLDRMQVDDSFCNRLQEEVKRREEERKLAEEQRKKAVQQTITSQYQYLQSRYQKNPEDKFPHQVPTSWDYGWRLGDTLKADKVKKSRFGRVSIVQNTFFTRTGIAFGEKPAPKPWYAC
ncbi:hypothetical protein D915_001743 [Fasciola hepatica]|uniref:Sperm microtubule inner protein 1 C-terminal domain-containing protein n=1 Tax=Fasciola hepatica TaxID=6192 RepID=A0A4E0RLG7_FASHE|nr:hypothetical protein D915_001743 [Fasciola hepatica]